MEATPRAATRLATGKGVDRVEFTEVRGVEGLREAYVALGEKSIHVAVANGLTNAKIVLDKIASGEEKVSHCGNHGLSRGCVGGGGQPYPPPGVPVLDAELLRQRAKALYTIDAQKKVRKSYENPAVVELYERFLGVPGSPKAHELLHTHYTADCREESDESSCWLPFVYG